MRCIISRIENIGVKMESSLLKIMPDIKQLSMGLLSTLDEKVFFNELTKFFSKQMKSDRVLVYKVLEDSSAQLISDNGKYVEDKIGLKKGEGATGYVIRTKKPYFSNNTKRDPLFSKEFEKGVMAELCMPIAQEGVLIGTIHFQSMENSDIKYSWDDVNYVLSILAELKQPLKNITMYFSAKYLNKILLAEIKTREKEFRTRDAGMHIVDSQLRKEKKIIAQSKLMKDLLALCAKVAHTDIALLIQGEYGIGKTALTRHIHCHSHRKDHPFIVLDCSSLSKDQLEIELFGREGHPLFEKRNFKLGLLESAHGGTLVLQDISHLPIEFQGKLAHFLKEKIALRVGGEVSYHSDLRIIATTNKVLRDEVQRQNFSKDLFYCLNTVTLEIPSLRDRKDDIAPLVDHFLNRNRKGEKKSLSPEALTALVDYSWPGNVKELENVIERANLLSDKNTIEKEHLSEHILVGIKKDWYGNPSIGEQEFVELTLGDLEKSHIGRTLEHLSGNKTKTAKALGITVKTLYNKLHSYGLFTSSS